MNYSPQAVFESALKKHKATLLIFLAVYLTGVLTHLYMFTNKFFNYFELGNIFADMSFFQGDTIAQGRWFIPIGSNLFTMYSTPVVNGLLSLLYMTLTALMIGDVIKLRGSLYRYIFGAAFVTFPGYACILSYGVNADAISMAAFLCTLGGWLHLRLKGPWAYVLSAVSIAPGLAIYQTYLCLPIVMVYGVLLFSALSERLELKPFAIRVLKAVIMLGLGFALYYIILKLSVVVTGVSLTDYHGVDSMTSFTPKGIAKGLVFSYLYFLRYFFTTEYIYSSFLVVLNIVGAVVFTILLAGAARARYLAGDRFSALMAAVLFAFLPLGVNATPFLMADRVGAGVDRYMIPSLMVLWGLLVKLMELTEQNKAAIAAAPKSGDKRAKALPVLCWLGLISALTAIISAGVICNEAYHRLDAVTNSTAMYFNRLAAHIEVMPEYRQGAPLLFANTRPLMSETYDVEQPAYEALRNMPGTELSPHYNERGVARYFRIYLHMPVNQPGDEEREAVLKSPEFKTMPAYPAEGSIGVIDGVITVKMTDVSD